MKLSTKGDIMLIIAALIGGMGFIGMKFLLDFGYGTLSIIAGRFWVSAILLIMLYFKKLTNERFTKNELKAGVLMGVLLFGLFFMFTTGLKYTTPAVNAFLSNCHSVFVPFAAWLIIRRRPDKYAFISAFMTVIGVWLLSMNDKMEFNLGAALSLMASVSFAFQVIATDRFARMFDPVKLTIIENLTVAVLALIWAVVAGSGAPLPDINAVLVFLGIGIGCTAIYFLLQTTAQMYTSATNTAVILSFEAVITAIASAIIFDEIMSVKMYIGCVILFLAIIVAETKLEFLFNTKTIDVTDEI
ncbi:MAG: DMT family transporter [Firmicutes bacterium]|nr:DMT family transporter [Bacillota bacterium]